jgi:molybdopterin-guanine dinucleotide biosynthesis protein B
MRVFGIAGWSGSGKTTLLERLVPLLVARGVSVSLIKHAHHNVDIDHPGKDSFRLRAAGCGEVLLTSGQRWALMHESRGAPELSFTESLARMSPCDLVLVEGFKQYPAPKLEVFRQSVGKTPLFPNDPTVIGVATTDPDAIHADRPLAVFNLEQPETMIDFILENAMAWDAVATHASLEA